MRLLIAVSVNLADEAADRGVCASGTRRAPDRSARDTRVKAAHTALRLGAVRPSSSASPCPAPGVARYRAGWPLGTLTPGPPGGYAVASEALTRRPL